MRITDTTLQDAAIGLAVLSGAFWALVLDGQRIAAPIRAAAQFVAAALS